MFFLRARGTVFKKDTAWAFRVDLGDNPATGRRQQILRQGFTTKRDAEAALNELVRLRTAGTAVTAKRVKLGEFLDEWLVTQQARLRETTHQRYSVSVARIKSVLGSVPLQSLAPLQIEAFYASIGKPNEGRALSPRTIRNTHVVLRKALSDAERLGLVSRNPGASARPPSFVRPEFDTWDSEQLRDFFASAQASRYFAAFVVSASTGMRRGEVLGSDGEISTSMRGNCRSFKL